EFLLSCALDRVFQILRFVFFAEGNQELAGRGRFHEMWIARTRWPQVAREKRHNHRLPFRAFRLVRSDELDRVVVGRKTNGARRREIVAQAFGEFRQNHFVRLRLRGLRKQGVEFACEITELSRGQQEQTCAQLRLLDNQRNCVEYRQAFRALTNLRERTQVGGNFSSTRQDFVNAKSRLRFVKNGKV